MKPFLIMLIIAILAIGGWFLLRDGGENDDGVIKIGVLAPLTGFAAEHGELVQNGIELARDMHKTAAVFLIYEDTACDPKKAVSGFNKLTGQDGVKVIIGLVCSGDALAIAPLAEQKKVVVVAATASSPDLTNAGEYFFRVYPSDDKDGELLARYIKSKGYSNVALYSINNDYGEGVSDAITSRVGANIVFHEKFSIDEKDFRSILTKAKSSIDAIVLVGFPDTTITFLRQKNELGLDQEVIASSAVFTADLFGVDKSLTDSLVFSNPDIAPLGRVVFAEAYKNKYNKAPVFPAEYGHDSMTAVMNALKLSSGDGNIKNYLYNVNETGASGAIRFDENGDRIGVEIKLYHLTDERMFECVFGC